MKLDILMRFFQAAATVNVCRGTKQQKLVQADSSRKMTWMADSPDAHLGVDGAAAWPDRT